MTDTENIRYKRRHQRQEELREKLAGLNYISQLEQISKKLEAEPDMEKRRLDVLKTRIDLNFRRLNKLLPDEKYLEVEADFGGEIGIRTVKVTGVKPQNT